MLEVSHLRAGYGTINVVWDVSFSVRRGELVTVVGPNGAGKTTLMRAIMGLVRPTGGTIHLDGQDISGTPPWRMSADGLVMVPEGRMIFRDMTIEENLMLGAYPPHLRGAARARAEEAYTMFPRLAERRRALAGTLSGGEAQMLAMARGLMADPRLIIFDEPSLGLAPRIVHELFAIIARLKAEGRTILLVEQNTQMAVCVADRVLLMQSGRIVFSQDAVDVNLEHLHDLYFAR